MTPPDSLPPTPTPSPLDGLPETEASRAIRSTVAEVIGTLQRLHATLAVEAGRLTEEERRSGQGKLLDGEAAVLAQVAHAAADNPALLKGLAAKDGGVDPARFEGDALLAHLALHVAARDAARALAAEAAALHTLLSDRALYHGAQARGPPPRGLQGALRRGPARPRPREVHRPRARLLRPPGAPRPPRRRRLSRCLFHRCCHSDVIGPSR